MKIVADAHIPYVQEYFSSLGELVLKPGREITAQDLTDAQILLVRSITKVSEALLAKSNIQFVGSITAGTDHLALKWLEEHNIAYGIASGFNAPPVADYVVAVIACLQKQGYLNAQKSKVAILGVGHVGTLVLERLKLLGFDVILSDPLRAQEDANFSSTPLEEIQDVDLITLHTPLTHQGPFATHHFINADFLAKQKPGCILLNTSRGAVIDSDVLPQYEETLQWCFDVWEHEPKVNKMLLYRALLATPHIAGYSIQSKIRGIDMIYKIACEQGVIQTKSLSPIPMPEQRLEFAGEALGWRDIVLGILNPQVMTNMMRAILLPAESPGPLFDKMRNDFNYRHEFKFTSVLAHIPDEDRSLLSQMGIKVL